MGRRTSREAAMKFLYQIEIQREDIEKQMELFIADNNLKEDNVFFMREIVDGVISNKKKLDELIEKNLKGWTIDRISKVDLSILRIAIYELLNRKDIPHNVSINEAVELAKKYSTKESSAFINGVLGKICEAQEDDK